MRKTIALFLHHPTCSIDSVNGVIAALSPMADIKLFTRHKVSDGFLMMSILWYSLEGMEKLLRLEVS